VLDMDILMSYDTFVVNGRALLIAFPALAELLTRFTSSSNPLGICSYRETPYPPLVLFPEAA